MDMTLAEQHVVKIINPLTTRLPAWFPVLDGPQHRKNVGNQIFFAVMNGEDYIGILHLQVTVPHNAHVSQLVVRQPQHFLSIAKKLLFAAEQYCTEKRYANVTVAASKSQQVEYDFYVKNGYSSFMQIIDPHSFLPIIYLQKTISLNNFSFIDLTHPLSAEVPHWGEDVGFKYNARNIRNIELPNGVKFRVQRLEMSAGIGTHMDAPSHCFEEASAIDHLPLERLITTCCVVDVSDHAHEKYAVTLADIDHFEEKYAMIPKDSFVIIRTGWDERWNEPSAYRNNKIFPYLSIEAAKQLLARNVAGIGIDTLSPDAFGSDFPVHRLMLGAGKYIVENVANAKQLDPIGNFIVALPIKIAEGTEAPMRLIGMKRI